MRAWLAPDALTDAYAVQALVSARRRAQGAMRIGRKIGLTSLAVQKQLGVAQPDFGELFDDMLLHGPRAVISSATLLQPRIEGELAFIVAENIDKAGGIGGSFASG
jgi:2-keto-4-pentenoate hydratase